MGPTGRQTMCRQFPSMTMLRILLLFFTGQVAAARNSSIALATLHGRGGRMHGCSNGSCPSKYLSSIVMSHLVRKLPSCFEKFPWWAAALFLPFCLAEASDQFSWPVSLSRMKYKVMSVSLQKEITMLFLKGFSTFRWHLFPPGYNPAIMSIHSILCFSFSWNFLCITLAPSPFLKLQMFRPVIQ